MDEERLCCLLKDLDLSLQPGQPRARTDFLIQKWNRELGTKEKKGNKGAEIAENMGLDLVADVIRNRGLRLRFLEDALSVDRVTLSGDVDIKQNLLKAIRGQEPLSVRVTGGSLKLTIRF